MNRDSQNRMQRTSALLAVLTMMAIMGGLQNALLIVLPGWTWIQNLDDALLVLAVLVAAPRFLDVRGAKFLGVLLWGLLIVIASIRSVVETGLTAEIARAMAVPAILILVGTVLRKAEWLRLCYVWLAISTLNVAYIFLEMGGIRLLDPAGLIRALGMTSHLFDSYQGLPGSFIYWHGDGSVAIRAGGLVINPPIAGTMVAIGAIVAFHVLRGEARWLLLLAHVVALYGTQGRGGYVILAIGLLLPLVVKRIGLLPGLGIFAPIAFVFYGVASSAGDSDSHVEGLIHGVQVAFASPLGEGYGTVGNLVKSQLRTEQSSESLAGIALVGSGFLALLLIVLLLVAMVRQMRRKQTSWEQYLGLAAIASALVSESSGALAGASLMWLAAGIALGDQNESKAFVDSRSLEDD